MLKSCSPSAVEPGVAFDSVASEAPAPEPSLRDFRPIHYLGSKLRALTPILESMDRLDPGRGAVCDLFAGSGTVAYAASQRRRVFAVDIQNYSATICGALLGHAPTITGEEFADAVAESEGLARLRHAALPLVELEQAALRTATTTGDLEAIAEILEEGALVRLDYDMTATSSAVRRAQRKAASGLADVETPAISLRHYGGVFFSYEQALVFDAARAVIRQLGRDRDALTAALLTAMSQTVNTVGKQFAQPLRLRSKTGQLKRHLRSKVLSDRSVDPLPVIAASVEEYRSLPRLRFDHAVICDDYRTALEKLRGRVSIVYADPPYTRDHYSRYYHVLETIAHGDDPEIARSNLGGGKLLSRGLYRADRHQSDFCIRSKAPDAFRALFAGARSIGVPLLLSYSAYDAHEDAHPRVVGLEDIRQLAEQFFPQVDVSELSLFNYSKLNHGPLHKAAEGTKELLISCS